MKKNQLIISLLSAGIIVYGCAISVNGKNNNIYDQHTLADKNDEESTNSEISKNGNAKDDDITSTVNEYDGNLRIEDGMLQPMLNYSDLRAEDYSNEDSDIIRYCVYIETDYDTDNDGMADLVKAFVQVPRGAVEGKYKAATIYDPTPYGVGTVDEYENKVNELYLEKEFDYDQLYNKGKKRTSEDQWDTLEAAAHANPEKDWNYTVPFSENKGYYYATMYDYYLVRGYAVVEASGIGTYGSEGYELCGTDLERDSHKCVVEWLTGERAAYTDKNKNIKIKADWSNGNVAMTGCSYGGTLPFEVATTGVKGLKTIIPYAGIASWYDYTNSQGIPIIFDVNYRDSLSAYNCGGVFEDKDWTVLDDDYRSWLWQVAQDEGETNGDYAPIWAETDYSDDYKKINCSAFIVQGLNDFNVTTRQAALMIKAFENSGNTVKVLLHQDGHNVTYNQAVNGIPWADIQNKWLAHYLYGVDNDVEEMAAFTVQSNIDGQYKEYDSFGDYETLKTKAETGNEISSVSSVGLSEYASEFVGDPNKALKMQDKDKFYMGLTPMNAARYKVDIPEGTTISGVPKINVRIASDKDNMDGLMITAILVDTTEDQETFKAYLTKDRLHDRLPVKIVDTIEQGSGLPSRDIYEFVKSDTEAKCFSFGWTDLCNPEGGFESSGYTLRKDPINAGKYYDYTFYMMPTVYTLEKGHKLELLIMAWDPYRAFLDEGFEMGLSLTERLQDFSYSFVIDNSSVEAEIPLINNKT